MKLLLTLLIFLSCISVQAQKQIISLTKEKFSKPVENIHIDSIIDLRYDKSKIGWVRKGLEPVKVQADFEEPFLVELNKFISKNSVSSGSAIPLILKVNKFEISEKTYPNTEVGTAEIALEFLAKKNNDFIKILDAASTTEVSSLTGVSGKHDENIKQALEACFAQLAKTNINEKINSGAPLEKNYLKVNTYYLPDYSSIPALSAKSIKSGVFQSFQEFKGNSPGITDGFTVKNNGVLIYSATGKKIENVWGFSDGNNIYMYYGTEKNYFPIKRQDNYFTFSGLVSTVNTGAVMMGGLVGGMIGGAVAGALTENTRKVDYILNMISGDVTEAQQYSPKTDLLKSAKVIFYRKAKSESSESVGIYVKDSLYAQLAPNSFVELNFKAPVEELNICLKSKNQACLKYIPVLERTRYVECGLPKKPEALPVIKTATEQEANYYLKIIKNTQGKI